ncbi:MAG: acyl-CoA dehydrogenase [Candidatus Dadabacteria bacterium]|nr:MAG: acyl-CoA dehydrogenase [Candidatus Dadabacteria bacterium]
MDLRFTAEDEAFRQEIRDWLHHWLDGEFAIVRGRGGPGDEEALFEERVAWEQHLAKHNWNCLDWPEEHGGRNLPLMQQVIFHEEYVKAGGPGRLGHIGETLAGPTIIAHGTDAQKEKFLPGIKNATERWCQGYSEPNAGSDLANVQTKAELVDGKWIINGQKVWTSGAQWSKWCFVLCRTDPDAPKHKGISYILVPMDQPGVEIRPIRQMTGTAEFNEVFFDNAEADADDVVGGVNNGWKVAMATLAFERGASTLGQQAQFTRELEELTDIARKNGKLNDPIIRDRIAEAWIGLRIMRLNALRTLSRADGPNLPREALIAKLYWATWHRDMGKLLMDVMGTEAEYAEDDGELTQLQRLFLFVRSDTIYAGTNQIQRNIIAERGLGLPR